MSEPRGSPQTQRAPTRPPVMRILQNSGLRIYILTDQHGSLIEKQHLLEFRGYPIWTSEQCNKPMTGHNSKSLKEPDGSKAVLIGTVANSPDPQPEDAHTASNLAATTLPSKCPQITSQDGKKPCRNSTSTRRRKSLSSLDLSPKPSCWKSLQIRARSNPPLSD